MPGAANKVKGVWPLCAISKGNPLVWFSLHARNYLKLPAEYPAIVRMMLILSHEILELKEIL